MHTTANDQNCRGRHIYVYSSTCSDHDSEDSIHAGKNIDFDSVRAAASGIPAWPRFERQDPGDPLFVQALSFFFDQLVKIFRPAPATFGDHQIFRVACQGWAASRFRREICVDSERRRRNTLITLTVEKASQSVSSCPAP